MSEQLQADFWRPPVFESWADAEPGSVVHYSQLGTLIDAIVESHPGGSTIVTVPRGVIDREQFPLYNLKRVPHEGHSAFLHSHPRGIVHLIPETIIHTKTVITSAVDAARGYYQALLDTESREYLRRRLKFIPEDALSFKQAWECLQEAAALGTFQGVNDAEETTSLMEGRVRAVGAMESIHYLIAENLGPIPDNVIQPIAQQIQLSIQEQLSEIPYEEYDIVSLGKRVFHARDARIVAARPQTEALRYL